MPDGSTYDREAQLERFRRVYADALQLISTNTLSSNDAAAFVRNATDGMVPVLKQIADAEAGLEAFIEECPPEDVTLLRRSSELLKDIADLQQRAQRLQRHFLDGPT